MERVLRILSRVISWILNPFLLVLFFFLMLFSVTNLAMLPLSYKIYVLLFVFLSTIFLPLLSILLYTFLEKKKEGKLLSFREHRFIPYALTILCYSLGYVYMQRLMVPYYMLQVYMIAILAMIVCSLVNVWWKISAHMTSAGAVTAWVVMFGVTTGVNVVWVLCGCILLSGLLGTARMILNEHSLSQILAGFLNGYLCTMLIIFM